MSEQRRPGLAGPRAGQSVHGAEESACRYITTPADDAALLALFDRIRTAYLELAAELAGSHRPCVRRRLLSKQRATYRAALTLVFALSEQAAEVGR